MNSVESVDTAGLKRLAGDFGSGAEQLSTTAQSFASRTNTGTAPFGHGDTARSASDAYANTRDQIVESMQNLQALMQRHSEALALTADGYDKADMQSAEIAANAGH
jgi:uncharacterized protein YukE